MASSPPKPLSLRRLIVGTLEVFQREAAVVLVIGLLFTGIDIGLRYWLDQVMPGAQITPVLARYIVVFVPFALSDAALVCAATASLAGGRASLAVSLGTGLRILAAALIVDLTESIFQMLYEALKALAPADPHLGGGLATLVVAFAGNGLLSCLLPSLGVAADERSDGFTSLARGWRLTRGYRLKLFALLCAITVTQFAVPLVVSAAATAGGVEAPEWLIQILAEPVGIFAALMQVVAYQELRRLREGVRHGDVDRIFG